MRLEISKNYRDTQTQREMWWSQFCVFIIPSHMMRSFEKDRCSDIPDLIGEYYVFCSVKAIFDTLVYLKTAGMIYTFGGFT